MQATPTQRSKFLPNLPRSRSITQPIGQSVRRESPSAFFLTSALSRPPVCRKTELAARHSRTSTAMGKREHTPQNPAAVAPPCKASKCQSTVDAAPARSTATTDVEMREQLQGGKLAPYVQDLPTENIYAGTNYYVRECYTEYYDVVMKLLGFHAREKDDDTGKLVYRGVTVTGTPGIGTSVFMCYVYQRSVSEHPDAIVVLVSYNTKSELTGLVVTKGDKPMERVDDNVSHMQDALSKYAPNSRSEKAPAALCLYDGPPNKIRRGVPWVSFTSLTEYWMKVMSKNRNSIATVYMPLWTRAELRCAAKKLGRNDLLVAISNDQLRSCGATPHLLDESQPRPSVLDFCFSIFGGVARECLALDALGLRVRTLEGHISVLSIADIAKAIGLELIGSRQERVLHCVPVTFAHRKAPIQHRGVDVQVASATIERFLFAREHGESRSQQQSEIPVRLAECIPETQSAQVFSLEAIATRLLKGGCVMDLVRLQLSGQAENLLDIDVPARLHTIEFTVAMKIAYFDHSQPQLWRFAKTAEQPFDGLYWSPKDETHSDRVLLLYTTSSRQQIVNVNECVYALKALRRVRGLTSKTFVAIVFVMPRWNRPNFRAQRVRPSLLCHKLDQTLQDCPQYMWGI